MMCSLMRLTVLSLGILSFGLCANAGLGAPKVFFGRDEAVGLRSASDAQFYSFTSGLLSYGVETVEGIDVGPPFFGFLPPLSFGSTGITASTQTANAAEAPGFSIDTKALLELDAAANPDPNAPPAVALDTVFTFNQPITAFGMYVIQGGDFGNNNPTTFRLKNTNNSDVVDIPVQIGPGWGLTNAFFLGVRSEFPFNEVTVLETADLDDGMLYDNLVAGFVPEPGSFLLMMFGGVCALCPTRRFRRD
jgi:hypothetical protein